MIQWSSEPFFFDLGWSSTDVWRSLCKWVFMELITVSRDFQRWEKTSICINLTIFSWGGVRQVRVGWQLIACLSVCLWNAGDLSARTFNAVKSNVIVECHCRVKLIRYGSKLDSVSFVRSDNIQLNLRPLISVQVTTEQSRLANKHRRSF